MLLDSISLKMVQTQQSSINCIVYIKFNICIVKKDLLSVDCYSYVFNLSFFYSNYCFKSSFYSYFWVFYPSTRRVDPLWMWLRTSQFVSYSILFTLSATYSSFPSLRSRNCFNIIFTLFYVYLLFFICPFTCFILYLFPNC